MITSPGPSWPFMAPLFLGHGDEAIFSLCKVSAGVEFNSDDHYVVGCFATHLGGSVQEQGVAMAALRMNHQGFLMGVLMVLLFLHLGAPALSLIVNTTTKGCSRECESRHCQDPFHLRYGKYCGVGYTGCAGEVACDGIDSCCLTHDLCIGSDLANYVNRSCNDQLKQCVERFQDANLTQFVGASCSATDLEDVIITMMNIATLGESYGSPSPLTNFQWVTALIINLPVVLLFENW